MTLYHQNVNVTADSRELKSSSHKQRSYSAINTLETDSNAHVKDVTVTVNGNVLLACCKYSAEVPVFKLSLSEGRVGEEKKKEKAEKEKEKERLKEMEKEKEKGREKERLREREMGKEKKKRNKEKEGDKRKERKKEKEKENVNEEKEKEKEKEKQKEKEIGCEVAPMKPLRKKTVADLQSVGEEVGGEPNRRTRTLGRSIANLV